VLKPNEAMIDEAVTLASGRPIGLLASFAPTAASMPREFPDATLDVELAETALAALDAGDVAGHDAAALRAAEALAARGCAVLALAQFSLARAAPLLRSSLGVPVLTTVDSAVARLRRRLGA
jgi:4'-phosphopantetheinyl transferase EntD